MKEREEEGGRGVTTKSNFHPPLFPLVPPFFHLNSSGGKEEKEREKN